MAGRFWPRDLLANVPTLGRSRIKAHANFEVIAARYSAPDFLGGTISHTIRGHKRYAMFKCEADFRKGATMLPSKPVDPRLWYELVGSGTPFFLVHGGLGFDHAYFRPWLDALSTGVTLVYLDLRGNGRSMRDIPLDGVSHATWVEDIEALRLELGAERIVLFGHSYGGFLAQEYALRHPERLAGLVLCSTAPALDHAPEVFSTALKSATAAQGDALQRLFTEPMVDDEVFADLYLEALPIYFHRYDPALGAAFRANTRFSASAWRHCVEACLPAYDLREQLPQIRVPTLLLAGVHDWIMPPIHGAARLKAGLPDAELALFEHSGHFPFMEEPGRFASIMNHWLRTHGFVD